MPCQCWRLTRTSSATPPCIEYSCSTISQLSLYTATKYVTRVWSYEQRTPVLAWAVGCHAFCCNHCLSYRDCFSTCSPSHLWKHSFTPTVGPHMSSTTSSISRDMWVISRSRSLFVYSNGEHGVHKLDRVCVSPPCDSRYGHLNGIKLDFHGAVPTHLNCNLIWLLET